MSKRHQSSRRKAYGRRQHEVRERAERRADQPDVECELDDLGDASTARRPTRSSFLDPRVAAPPLRVRRLRWPSTRAPARAPSRCRRRPDAPMRPARPSRRRAAAPAAAPAVRARRGPAGARPCSWRRSSSRSLLAFFSLAQTVRVSATSYEVDRLAAERERLEARLPGHPLATSTAWAASRRSASRASTPGWASWPSRSSSPPARPIASTDAGSDRFARRACSSCCRVRRRGGRARRAPRVLAGGPRATSSPPMAARQTSLRTEEPSPARRDLRPERRRSSWPRPSSATGSSRRPTCSTAERARRSASAGGAARPRGRRRPRRSVARCASDRAVRRPRPRTSTPRPPTGSARGPAADDRLAGLALEPRAGAGLPAGRRRPGDDAGGAPARLRQPRGRRASTASSSTTRTAGRRAARPRAPQRDVSGRPIPRPRRSSTPGAPARTCA